jgi:hypothetical protein
MIEAKIQDGHLGLKVAVYNTVVSHQRKGHEHLARETPNEGRREPDKAIRFDELV